MKKQFWVELEYDESQSDLEKTLGISDDEWQGKIGEKVLDLNSGSITSDLFALLDSGEVKGPELIGLACGGLDLLRRAGMARKALAQLRKD